MYNVGVKGEEVVMRLRGRGREGGGGWGVGGGGIKREEAYEDTVGMFT